MEFTEAMKGSRQQVRDGYLADLPDKVKTTVMNIHKLIKKAVDELLEDEHYSDLKDSRWAMSCIDDFCVMPKDKGDIGSIRVYKKGANTYSCMIQMTGHFRNHEYGWIEELLHEFICNVYATVRPTVRKKYDYTITNEGKGGEPYEGFDVYPPLKVAREIWENLEGRKTRTITEEAETTVNLDDQLITEAVEDGNRVECGFKKLPKGLAHEVNKMNQLIKDNIVGLTRYKDFDAIMPDDKLKVATSFITGRGYAGQIGKCTITKSKSGVFTGEVVVTPMPEKPVYGDSSEEQKALNRLLKVIEKRLSPDFDKENPNKKLVLTGPKGRQYFIIALKAEYAQRLYDAIAKGRSSSFKEAADNSESRPEYMGDLSPAEAKRTLRTLSQSIINDTKTNKSKKVTQYTANIYANIITKNLLPQWAPSFRKLSITLTDYQSFNTVEFKIPKMTQDFIARFIQGRESLEGFLHRQPEIKMKISPRVFHTMKSADDGFNFFKAAITYYDKKIGKAGQRLMAEVMRLNQPMKHLIGSTKLMGIVTYPMALLFSFSDVDMSAKDTFDLTADEIRAISNFVRNIPSKYAAPEKEKAAIVNDVKDLVKTLRETCEMDENLREFYYLPEAVSDLYAGKFDSIMGEAQAIWENEQVDHQGTMDQSNFQAFYMREAFGVKKLKKIPRDLVAYIQIETECIKDANDKMMISSYCLSKLEIVEWYIELIDVGSKKYIVPHNRPYLESLRTQLLACHKKIMETPVPKPGDRPIIDIKYPKGYEG